MALCFEVPVTCLADLMHVDARVRALCNTTAGAQCQSLLTTEYQCWRHTVARMLLAREKTPCAPPPGATDAYLSGICLRFVPPICLITQSLPTALAVHAGDLRKRKQHALGAEAPRAAGPGLRAPGVTGVRGVRGVSGVSGSRGGGLPRPGVCGVRGESGSRDAAAAGAGADLLDTGNMVSSHRPLMLNKLLQSSLDAIHISNSS
jgi:hypothetical protein